jgi:hypothetical protein
MLQQKNFIDTLLLIVGNELPQQLDMLLFAQRQFIFENLVYTEARNVETIFDIFSYVGGVTTTLKMVFMLFGAVIARIEVRHHLTIEMYGEEEHRKFCNSVGDKNQDKKVRQRLERDLDFVYLVDSIYKLKAIAKVILATQPTLLFPARFHYFKSKYFESSQDDVSDSFFEKDSFDSVFGEIKDMSLKKKAFRILKEKPIEINE